MKTPFLAASIALALTTSTYGQCELQHLFHVTETPLVGPAQAELGTSLALDGDRMLAGAPHEGLQYDGAVIVYERAAGTWSESARLIAAPPPGDRRARSFGCDVALEGDRALVGAKDQGTSQFNASGAAYLFEKGPLGWTTVHGLVPSVQGEFFQFGHAVALSGEVALVGAWNEGYPDAFGAVYVFERSPTGSHWSEVQRLVPSTPAVHFGSDVAMDGDVCLIGSAGNFSTAVPGTVHVFERLGGQWLETGQLAPPDTFVGFGFGTSVALDGNQALVGAPGALDVTPGSVHHYERSGSRWHHRGELRPRHSWSLYLGTSVALNGDMAVVGAYAHEDPVHEAGTGWFFVRTAAGWEERAKLADPTPNEYETAGASVALGADGTALVGIPGDILEGRWGKGSVLAWDTANEGCATLSGSPERISISGHGTQAYLLQAPPSSAGDPYWLLASENGTSPGFDFGAVHLPLNAGAALRHSLRFPNAPPFANSLGVLNGTAEASASFTAPPVPSLIGLRLHLAFVTWPAGGPLAPPSGASNATVLEFRP